MSLQLAKGEIDLSLHHGLARLLQESCRREADGFGSGGNRPATLRVYHFSAHDWLAVL